MTNAANPTGAPTEVNHLGLQATRFCAKNALAALCGIAHGGSVSAEGLAKAVGLPRMTLLRRIRQRPGQSKAIPFELVVRSVFDPDFNGQRFSWETALSSFSDDHDVAPNAEGELENVKRAMKRILTQTLEGATTVHTRVNVLTQFLLVTAALAHDAAWLLEQDGAGYSRVDAGTPGKATPEKHAVEGTDDRLAKSLDLIKTLKANSYEIESNLYTGSLRLLMGLAGQKMRNGYRAEDLAVALQSLLDGYLLRHYFAPDELPLKTLVDVLWDLSMGMTEPVQAPRDSTDPRLSVELRAIHFTLDTARAMEVVPSLDQVQRVLEGDIDIKDIFPTTSDLARACIRSELANAVDLRTLAEHVPRGSLRAVYELLRTVGIVTERYQPLVRAIEGPLAWDELENHLSTMISMAEPKLRPVDIGNTSLALIQAALIGARGVPVWETILKLVLDDRSR